MTARLPVSQTVPRSKGDDVFSPRSCSVLLQWMSAAPSALSPHSETKPGKGMCQRNTHTVLPALLQHQRPPQMPQLLPPGTYLVGDAAGQEQVGAGSERRPHLLAAGRGQGMRHLPQRLGPGGREGLRGARAARHCAGAGQRPRQGRRERRPRRLGEKLRGRGRSLPATAAIRGGAGGGG